SLRARARTASCSHRSGDDAVRGAFLLERISSSVCDARDWRGFRFWVLRSGVWVGGTGTSNLEVSPLSQFSLLLNSARRTQNPLDLAFLACLAHFKLSTQNPELSTGFIRLPCLDADLVRTPLLALLLGLFLVSHGRRHGFFQRTPWQSGQIAQFPF